MKSLFYPFLTIFILAVLFFTPFFAKATVYLNEMAWMGTAVSANNEWLELYNNGDSEVDLSGWTLSAADGSPEIDFSNAVNKTIPAGGLYLLERTDDTTMPDIKADLIYTGAMSNDGEILVLKDKNGKEVDRVDGGSKWPAGDNATKQTMQKAVGGGGWITANATPKTVNASNGQSSSQISSAVSNSAQNSSLSDGQTVQSGSGAIAWPSEPQIYANAGGNKTAIVGGDVLFEGRALGLKKEPLENVRYLWNFGDGAWAEGKSVKYFYKHPGEYIAVLDIASGQYSASERINVKIIPNKLEIIEADNDFIKFKNGSDAVVDISGWFVKAGQNIFTFPTNSLLAAENFMILSSDVSGIRAAIGQAVELLYPNGSVAFSYLPRTTQETSSAKVEMIGLESQRAVDQSYDSKSVVWGSHQPSEKITTAASLPASTNKIKETKIIPKENVSKNLPVSTSPIQPNNQTANIIYVAGSKENFGWKKWLYLSLGLGIIGGGGLFFVRRNGGV